MVEYEANSERTTRPAKLPRQGLEEPRPKTRVACGKPPTTATIPFSSLSAMIPPSGVVKGCELTTIREKKFTYVEKRTAKKIGEDF